MPHQLLGTNLKYAKAYNYRIVLETIRLHGPVSRAEVARRTGLTAQTISNITRRLFESDLIRENERFQEGRGAPSTLLTLNPEGAFSVGLDLDKDHLTGVLVDFVGKVRQRLHFELNFPSPDEAMDLLETTTRELLRKQDLSNDRVWGVGVGLPGPLDISEGSVVTNIVNPKAYPGWKNVPVGDILSKRLSFPIYLENNATAAAVGERWYGAGQRISTFFYIYFGAGLGGGLIINGQPFDGHTGNAGELGYFPTVEETTDSPSLFQKPHLGIHYNLPRLYQKLGEYGTPVHSPNDLQALFLDKHPVLIEWLDTAAQRLAPLILAVEYIIDPEAIFFGGRLPNELVLALLERLEVILPSLRIQEKRAVPSLRCADAGSDAAALGVATLPMYTSFAPTHKQLMIRSDADEDPAFIPVTAK